MKDSFGRTIDYLRISLTDRCNLRCSYCMPQEGALLLAHEDILSLEEILRLVKIMAGLGITKVRLTGGEPLLRRNCTWLMGEIKKVPGIDKLALTTNGTGLSGLVPELLEAGLSEVNISLDSLNEVNYTRICHENGLQKVLEGIDAAYDAGLKVKINCVPVRELNYDDLAELAGLSKVRTIDVRFIELMPVGCGKQFSHVPSTEISAILEEKYGKPEILENTEGSAAEYVRFHGFAGRTGFISPLSHSFCKYCRRIRLTSDGFLKLCLASNEGVNLKQYLRNDASDVKLAEVICGAVMNKPAAHHFENVCTVSENKTMNRIGG